MRNIAFVKKLVAFNYETLKNCLDLIKMQNTLSQIFVDGVYFQNFLKLRIKQKFHKKAGELSSQELLLTLSKYYCYSCKRFLWIFLKGILILVTSYFSQELKF